MQITCKSCGTATEAAAQTCKVTLYRYQPWFSWLTLHCTCEATQWIFLGPSWRSYLVELAQAEVEVDAHDFAPEHFVRDYEAVFDIHSLKQYALTTRFEEEVATLHNGLENIPDELLWESLTSPEPPHQKPERWT